MQFLYYFFIFYLISSETVKAAIEDFIVTEENKNTHLDQAIDLSEEGYDEYTEMYDYDSCGYDNPAEQNIFFDPDDGDHNTEMLLQHKFMEALQKFMRAQEAGMGNIQELFAELNTNPEYAELLKQAMIGESFDGESTCSNSPSIDVFNNRFYDEEL